MRESQREGIRKVGERPRLAVGVVRSGSLGASCLQDQKLIAPPVALLPILVIPCFLCLGICAKYFFWSTDFRFEQIFFFFCFGKFARSSEDVR